MRDEVVGRLLRMVRIRRGLRQEDVAARSHLDRSSIARIEAGETERFHVASLRRHAGALGFRLEITLSGRGGEASHLLDEEHAAIVEYVAGELTQRRWAVEAEASYSEFGERGRVDILAHHAGSGELLVVEVKTELVDLQQLFGSLNVKARLARRIAAGRFEPVRSVSVMVAVADTTATRATVAAHPTLFAGYASRGHAVAEWLERPASGPACCGLSQPLARDTVPGLRGAAAFRGLNVAVRHAPTEWRRGSRVSGHSVTERAPGRGRAAGT